MGNVRTNGRRSGNALVEVAFMMPWLVFLFVGVFDFGFYAYALICVQNGARIAALYSSVSSAAADDSFGACSYALGEMKNLPNIGSATTCTVGCADGSACAAGPMTVKAELIPAGSSPDGIEQATRVTLNYRTLPLIPIPGLMMGQLQVNRVVEMRVKKWN